MTPTMTTFRTVAVMALLGLAAVAGAADDQLTTTLRGVVDGNLRAYDAKDAEGVLRGVHTRSPEYDTTKAALTEQFGALAVTATLIDFKYVGHDDEFAVARVKTKLVGPAGSGFSDNVTDSIVLFHQEGGTWKVWSDKVLGVQFIAK
jgi:hypothetical protein